MDAQNANEAASPKPSASSASSRLPDSDRQKPSSASVVVKSPALSRAALPSKDAKPSSSKSALGPASNDSSKTPGSKSSTTASRDLKENKEPKDQKDSKDTKESKEAKEQNQTKESRDTKDSREPKGSKDHKDPKNTKDTKDTKSSTTAPSRNKHQDFDGITDESSEAETIVLSKDGSPAKPRNRKVIKHEDKSNIASSSSISVASADSLPRRHLADKKDGQPDKNSRSAVNARDGSAPPVKKKRLHDKLQPSSKEATRGKNTSSSLSSVPGSPPRSRNTSSHPPSGSDTDHIAYRSKSPRRALSTAPKDRLRPPEKLIPNKRKALKYDSDDDVEIHSKARRQRLANAGSEARSSKDSPRLSHGNSSNSGSLTKSLMSRSSRDVSLNRSESPPPRSHRRSLSTHATSQSNGLAVKKKRVPAPLQTTDYQSDDSSASGSSRVRSAKLRNLAAPTTAESSPAKIVAHKKHLDAHGQTYLARACARGEYDMAKKRLAERPEDLNTADFAGNTPLQIAALNGYGNIVKLLIEAGCNLDCVNNDKDTPLLDAVDNGHLEVVQLLLDAGVNPRKANVNGEEPLDRVDDSVDNADAIRTALIAAKKNVGGRRITSEEHHPENDDLRSMHDLDESPRRSPAPAGSSSSRRTGTIRATKTSNHLLYMPMDDKTLRLAAGRGDEQNVIRILQVRDAFDDPESMVAASRGGHDVVLQLLLALGKANPDPAPVAGVPPEHATPILAAIGQENIKVVSLLLEQSNFDPTQRFNGDTYYEIAKQRAGPNWKEEEEILKKAYDSYKKQNGNKTKSPAQKNPESRRAARAVEHSDESSTAASRVLKRKLSSSSLERPKKTGSSTKAAGGSIANTREEKETSKQKRADSSTLHSERERHSSPKRASSSTITSRTKPRDDRSSVTSNLDGETPPPTKQVKSRKTDSDSVAMSSEGETKPRRKKLISGRELKDGKVREKEKEKEHEKEKEREKQDKQEKKRRPSLASTNTATPPKDSASPRESRNDDAPSEKARVDKHRERDRDRARQLKKEDSKDTGATGDVAGKRHRLSETPPNATSSDKDGNEAPVKRRRLEADSEPPVRVKKMLKTSNGGKPAHPGSLPTSKPAARREESADERKSSVSASSAAKTKKRQASTDRVRKELKDPKDSSKSSLPPMEKSIHVKSEDMDVEMADVSDAQPSNGSSTVAEAKAQRDKKRAEKAEKAEKAEAEAKKKEEEIQRRRKEEDEKKKEMEEKKKKKEEEEKRKREEEEAARLKEEEKKAEEKKKEEELKKAKEKKAAEEKKKEEEETLKRKKQEEEEERQRKEEERKRKEEEEKKKREEAELKRVEEERKRKREEELAEEQRKKREEEERLHKEKLAREAAAKELERKREEEERQERLKREQEQLERERARAKKEAEERRLQLEEHERNRVASLPPLLRWLSAHPNPKQSELASLFKVMQGVRYDCINTDANGTAAGREQWLLNTQVALLFGDKDLELTRFPTWRHFPVSQVAKQIIWNLESDRYALTDPLLFDLGGQVPDLYGAQGPRALGSMGLSKLRNDAEDKFFATDMFFVKVADVMATVPSLPHLHNVRMALEYRELPEHESQLLTLALNPKWKSDPDAEKNLGFAPGTKYFINGAQIGENRAGLAKDSKTPPRAVRVPRRGFVSVAFNDPEFEVICKEQSIDPFSFPAYNTLKSQSQLANGVPKVNGIHPLTNGTLPNGQAPRPTVNGIHDTSDN